MFTINNPEDEQIPRTWEGVLYCQWQVEVGESGTRHVQGYVAFKCNKRLSILKKVHPTAHWERRKGTHNDARAYCSKEDTRVAGPWEIGDELSCLLQQGVSYLDVLKLTARMMEPSK